MRMRGKILKHSMEWKMTYGFTSFFFSFLCSSFKDTVLVCVCISDRILPYSLHSILLQHRIFINIFLKSCCNVWENSFFHEIRVKSKIFSVCGYATKMKHTHTQTQMGTSKHMISIVLFDSSYCGRHQTTKYKAFILSGLIMMCVWFLIKQWPIEQRTKNHNPMKSISFN